MTAILWIKTLSCSALLALSIQGVSAETVAAYTTLSQPFLNPVDGAQLCYVDQANQLLANLAAKMQGMGDQASVKNMLSAEEEKALSSSVVCSYQAAMQGIAKVPAVLVNGRYVVYGNLDMADAVEEVDHAKAAP